MYAASWLAEAADLAGSSEKSNPAAAAVGEAAEPPWTYAGLQDTWVLAAQNLHRWHLHEPGLCCLQTL